MDEANFGGSWESGAFDRGGLGRRDCALAYVSTLVQYLTGLMRCRRLDTGDDVFLIADMDLRCYDLTHGSWLFLCILLVLYIMVFPRDERLAQYEGQDFWSSGCVTASACSIGDTIWAARGGGNR